MKASKQRSNGHALGVWYLVDERLHAAMCVVCDEMVWVARAGDEERWRLGGGALHEGCFRQEEEDRGSELGAQEGSQAFLRQAVSEKGYSRQQGEQGFSEDQPFRHLGE